jgi:Bifunctional DNA primase/polymerase, N-terminal/AAA domain/Primase C terminal 1 (PriCT-1)
MPINQHGFPFNGNVKLKEAALIYVEAGFSIIPLHWIAKNKCSCGRGDCASPAKHPVTQHGLKDASNDPAQIKAWWKQYPKANIGVCTGQASNGLTVIDIDVAKGGQIAAVDIPITLEVETGAGFHFWLRSSQEIKNSAGKLGQGIDVRGWGGYVVAPPSVHSTGRIYTFRNQDPIADFPLEILAKLQPPVEEDQDLILSYSSDMMPDFAPEGSRNDFLARIGGKLRRQGFSPTEIESTLLTTNLQRCSPPLTDKEVRRIAQSVGRYIPVGQIDSQIEDEPDLTSTNNGTHDPDSQPDLTAPETNSSGREPLIGAITTGQLRTTVFGKPEMVLQGLFRSDWGLVIGIGSVGKSAFLFNVCVSLASGRPFLPIVPEGQQPRRILYLDFEGNNWRSQEQVEILGKALTEEENQLVDENLHWAIEPEVDNKPLRLNDRKSLQNLAAYIKQHKIDLVIIDTVAQAANLRDENSNAEVQQNVVVPIRRLTKHCDVAALLVHHEGRGKTQNKVHDSQYRGRGATSLMDASRYQIAMVPYDPDKRGPTEIINSKNKGYGFEKVTMVLDEESRWFTVPINPPSKPAPKPEELILDVLDARIEPEGMTVNEIAGMIPGIPRRTIERKLTEMAKEGVVIKAKRGLYRPAPPPSDPPPSDPDFDLDSPP